MLSGSLPHSSNISASVPHQASAGEPAAARTTASGGRLTGASGRPHAALEALQASTQTLLTTVDGLTDEDVRAPSLLPGWTRGHVLTHLARSADAMLNLVASARTGREHPMYPSREQRDADIDAGAGRGADELRADLREAHERLTAALDELPDEQWSAPSAGDRCAGRGVRP